LISIAKAQDIHVEISNGEVKFCRENSAATKFCRNCKQFRRKILPQTKFFCHGKDFTPSSKFAGPN
jgi:hypothetical protein